MRMTRLLLILLVLTSSCRRVRQQDEFVLKPRQMEQIGLKLGGYYYSGEMNDSSSYLSVSFFYQNGVVFSAGAYPAKDKKDREDLLRDAEFIRRIHGIKRSWGIYSVKGDSIFMEAWTNVNAADHTLIYRGKVLNDTTFGFFESVDMITGEVERLNVRFHYRPFAPKPDSIPPDGVYKR